MVGLITLAIAIFLAMVGTMVYGYKVFFGDSAEQSEEETSRQLRESTAWLSYIAWTRVGLPTDPSSKRAAAARVLDLERQFFGVPEPPLLCRLFSCFFPSKLFRAVKKVFTALTSGSKSATKKSRRDKRKASRRLPRPQIPTTDAAESTIVTKGDGSSAMSAGTSRNSTAHGINSTNTKDGGENETHGSTSSKQTTDKTSGCAPQHVLAPPPKARNATSSKPVESPTGPTASCYGNVISPIAAIYVLDPIRPVRKPLTSSKHVESPTGPTTSRHGNVISPIATIYALDPIRPVRKPLTSSKHVESPTGPAASHHGHVASPIAARYGLDPIRPVRKPLPQSKHVESPTGLAASHHGHVAFPIGGIYALDTIHPVRKPLPPSSTMPGTYPA